MEKYCKGKCTDEIRIQAATLILIKEMTESNFIIF